MSMQKGCSKKIHLHMTIFPLSKEFHKKFKEGKDLHVSLRWIIHKAKFLQMILM